MKAIILVGGEGTRLRPITYSIPKCMVPINNRTLTELVFDILKKYGIHDVILSTAYKKEMVKDYFKDHFVGMDIEYVEETEPLGTAGPLIIMNKENRKLKDAFFMINGDNLFDLDLKEMLEFHDKNKATVTIALSKVEDPRSFGVAVLEGDRIKTFLEKPKDPPTNLINSGYYIMEPEVFDLVKGKDKAMIEKDIFPVLAEQGKLFGYPCDGKWFDTGTPDRLEQVKKEWKIDQDEE